MSGLEQELDELNDDAPIEQASDDEALREAIEVRSQEWHRWVDELRVQADLAGKDAKSVLGDALSRLEDAMAAFTSLAKQAASDAGGATDELRTRSRAVAHDLDRAARTALDRLRG